MKDYVKEAEENIVNQSIFLHDLMDVIDNLHYIGNGYIRDYNRENRDRFFEGKRMMQEALRLEYQERLSQMLSFLAIGGEKAKKFALEELDRMYGKNRDILYSIMHLLDEHGRSPRRWLTEDEKAFRQQLQDKIEENK